MKHISLFSGIGGFDLAAEMMGWKNIAHCEIDPFCRKVLQYYWPNADSHEDIKKTDFKQYRGTVDIVSGGFPCQPYSLAGKRRGKEDDRHLWPEMLRAIREIQPEWIVGENVFGLINWSGGLVFDEVQADLEAQGYEVQAYVLPACAKNAPHRRDRVWIVAYSGSKHSALSIQQWRQDETKDVNITGKSIKRTSSNTKSQQSKRMRFKQHSISESEQGKLRRKGGRMGDIWNAANANSGRQPSEKYRKAESRRLAKESFSDNWQDFPTQSPVCSGDDGFSIRLDGITFPKWRNESIKAAGNAVVMQVVLEIFKAIEKNESIHSRKSKRTTSRRGHCKV